MEYSAFHDNVFGAKMIANLKKSSHKKHTRPLWMNMSGQKERSDSTNLVSIFTTVADLHDFGTLNRWILQL